MTKIRLGKGRTIGESRYLMERCTVSLMRDSSGTWETPKYVEVIIPDTLGSCFATSESRATLEELPKNLRGFGRSFYFEFPAFDSTTDVQVKIDLIFRRPDSTTQRVQHDIHYKYLGKWEWDEYLANN